MKQIRVRLRESLFEHEILTQLNGRVVKRHHIETETFGDYCLPIWQKHKGFCTRVTTSIKE